MLQDIIAVAQGYPTTLLITFAGFFAGATVGIPVALGRRAGNRLVRGASMVIIDVFRGIPPIAMLLLVYFGFGQNLIQLSKSGSAIVGLALISMAYMAEIYRSGLRSLPAGQWDAARSVGLSPVKLWWLVIGPQALIVILPAASSLMIIILMASALASVIGAPEITFEAQNLVAVESASGLLVYVAAAIVYLALSLPTALALRALGNYASRYLAS